ncbi:MBL fold metallo-hydrolase [Pedobacter cryophilus]|uniref:MBL fold metallo-hydrolase n=1 Tax=Pedobacter cryophilus TaxID=2571271 RepID=A0A4U1C1F2_9SPHI|nr:MBL fold metallo-hydrolase [Pedobacter cryophilus]TKB97930.1 MBL fold metallo-hydrolase [Pedobacter cryophilus]
MKVTFLGTGTSQGVPVIACNCEVCTSVNQKDKRLRSSILIESANKTVVIDTGPDFRYQMLRANVQKLDAVVFTHQHKDHIAGLDDIRAFNYKQKAVMDIYATLAVQESLKREFYYVFSDFKYPGIPQIDMHEIHSEPFSVGDIELTPIEVMHFKMPVLGFRINDFTYITDAKTISESEIEKIKGSKTLVINALQKEKHISHFTLEEAIAFAQMINAETTYFTHISHKLGKHEDVAAYLPKGIQLAYDGQEIHI